jgi:bifunctional polynucleotide phosphatase/kinase
LYKFPIIICKKPITNDVTVIVIQIETKKTSIIFQNINKNPLVVFLEKFQYINGIIYNPSTTHHTTTPITLMTMVVWNTLDTSVLHGVYISPVDVVHDENICFDLDSTLIKTKSGRKFSIDSNDWQFLYDHIVYDLKNSGKNVIIFSNQLGLKNDEKINEFKNKIENISKILDVSFQIFVSIRKDWYRKPCTGMWSLFNTTKKSVYIGDAAGRIGDFSTSDRKFAENIVISFFTPEEYFLKHEKTPFQYTGFNPYTFQPTRLSCLQLPFDKNISCIMLVGYPGSGKTTYAKNILKNYKILNQDELKTKKKVLAELKICIQNNIKCVLDNTTTSLEQRTEYLDVIKKYSVDDSATVICIEFDTDLDICKHNNMYRFVSGEKNRVPDLVYNMMKSKYKKPSKDEGFLEIIKMPFILNVSKEKESLWRRWYI